MKIKEKKEMHDKTVVELRKDIADKKKAVFSAKLEHTQGRLKNPRSLKALRISIAQMLTILREKELAASQNQEV
jgi:large subunit ribosomal protein L29